MATFFTLSALVAKEDPQFRETETAYQFTNRTFNEGDSVYRNNAVGIGYMIIEGGRGNRFIVSPDGMTGAALEQWLKENQ